MSKLTKKILVSAATFLLSTMTYADGTKCNLHTICSITPASSYLYIPVSPDLGTNYTCLFATQQGKETSVEIYSEHDFIFTKQNLSTTKKQGLIKTKIQGFFVDTAPGQILVHRTSSDDVKGYIVCSPK